MICVTFKQNLRLDTGRRFVAKLRAGVRYLMTHYHVGRFVPAEVCTRQEVFDHRRPFAGEVLGSRSLLIVWLAGMGDTIAAAPGLIALRCGNPNARIDVVTVPALYEIFESAGFTGSMVSYPCPAEVADAYDFFLPIEQTAQDPDCFRLHSIDFRAKLLHQRAGLKPVHFAADSASRRRMRLASAGRPRAGVQVQSLSPIRSYPADLMAEVLRQLVRGGYEVHLLGEERECTIEAAPPLLNNHCGQTTRFAELVALLEQMDLVICPDSLMLHLAGSMGIPTVALLSTMPARLRTSRYPAVRPLEPSAPCAPCMAIHDHACPLGHAECVAMRCEPMSPAAVVRSVHALLDTGY